MNAPKPNPLVRLLPSATDVAFVLPIVCLFAQMDGAKTMLGDGDTGWHVRTGEWILANWRVPDKDVFSYTKPGEPWFAWEWLWDVAFAWLHQHGGMAAVVIASILVLSCTFALLFRLVRRRSQNVFIAFGVTTLALAGSSIHWLARPHLFTFLFVVIFYWILELARDGRPRALLALPPLMVLWTNIHGGFFIGLIMLGAYAAGELIAGALAPDRELRAAAFRRSQPYIAAGLGCFLATFVNPYFYHLHVHIVRFLSGSFALKVISEYQPLNFQSVIALYFEPVFFLSMIAAAWNLYRKQFVYTILLAGWAHLALFSARNLPIFLLIAAPIIAAALEDLLPVLRRASLAGWFRRMLGRFEETAAEFGAVDSLPRVYAASFAAAGLLALAFYIPNNSSNLRAEYDPKRYPAKALATLRSSESERIFTHDEWGDYLIYQLYPQKKVFVDGRFDFYGPKFGEKYLDVMNVKYDWEQDLSRYDVDTILLPVDASLAGALKQSRGWRVVYDDGVAIVFRSVSPRHLRIASGAASRVPAGSAGGDHSTKTTRGPATKPNTRS